MASTVEAYADRVLLPVEVLILARYREALSARVLELGCGAGRLLGYLAELGRDAHGIDLSPPMVEYCRRNYPAATADVWDIAALPGLSTRGFGAVLACNNVLDVFDDQERRRVLADVRELIDPAGLLIFSSHNLACLDGHAGVTSTGTKARHAAALLAKLADRPGAAVRGLPRIRARIRNRRRLRVLEHRGTDHAVINDAAHDYSLLHYYIRPEDQERQLSEIGYELLECLDVAGRPVRAGDGSADPWLHYIARRR